MACQVKNQALTFFNPWLRIKIFFSDKESAVLARQTPSAGPSQGLGILQK
jgi:hypothetical protein